MTSNRSKTGREPRSPTRLRGLDSSHSLWWLVGAMLCVVAIMAAHYLTDMRTVPLHNLYRRLVYIPIVLAAFAYGVKGGVLTAVVACLAYLPHAFFSHHRDPSPTIDKVLEMVLYVAIGALTGWLVDRRQQARRALEQSLAERDALEQQLVRAGKMSALGQMTAGLAHEIRNPLASITGSAEALAAEFDASHRKHRMGQLLLAEIERLNRAVSDFVQFARPAAPSRSRVNLLQTARDVIDLTAAEATKRRVSAQVEIGEGVSVEADADQIRQVLLNLLLNAYQAFDVIEGGASADRLVRVISRPRDVAGRGYLGIGVSDNGPGIPRELVEEVFNPYFSTRPDGSGLGLSVSTRLVEAHDGFMAIEQGDGETTVWFYLPSGGGIDVS